MMPLNRHYISMELNKGEEILSNNVNILQLKVENNGHM